MAAFFVIRETPVVSLSGEMNHSLKLRNITKHKCCCRFTGIDLTVKRMR